MYKNSDENTLTLGGDEIPYQFCRLPQSELKYYPENPRIYGGFNKESYIQGVTVVGYEVEGCSQCWLHFNSFLWTKGKGIVAGKPGSC